MGVKLDPMFLSEIKLSHSIPVQEFTILGESTQKGNRYGNGPILSMGFAMAEFPKTKNLTSHSCFHVTLVHGMSFVYYPQVDDIAMFGSIIENINDHPLLTIHICGNFNIHHKKLLVHSNGASC